MHLGNLPENLRCWVVRDPNALHGTWIEVDKPIEALVDILSIIGLSAVKRRIVARCKCTMDLHLVNGKAETEASCPSEPQSPSTMCDDDVPLVWHQKQYFPLGKTRELEFIADGSTAVEQPDPETATWTTTATWIDGMLIQKRFSEQIGVTMYDTRCVLQSQVDLFTGEPVMTDSSLSSQDIQLFQWKVLVEQEGKVVERSCRYYLLRQD